MSALVLVDTSAWTQALGRHGDAVVRTEVEELLAQESAAWCDVVRLELWHGVRGQKERERSHRFRLQRSTQRGGEAL